MTQTQKKRFYHVRAVQLAAVYLMRRDDLDVQDATRNLGIDLLVSLKANGQDEGKIWGIDVPRPRH